MNSDTITRLPETAKHRAAEPLPGCLRKWQRTRDTSLPDAFVRLIWGTTLYGYEKAVWVYIRHLREKLESQ